MKNLLWAECKKLRRSNIIWITVFAAVMIAVLIFIGGLEVYTGSDVHSGLKTVRGGSQYIDNAGWYMDEVQPWSIFFALPGVIALFGSYIICREEDEDTLKSLRLIPINEVKLTAAKMIVTFWFSIGIYLLLFTLIFLTESVLHFSDLSAALILVSLKEYFLDGAGMFLAISPIIAFAARIKKYWLALVLAELYSVAGMFAGMSNSLKNIYPVTAIFNLSGYNITTAENRVVSVIALLLCGCLSILILKGLNRKEK